MKAPPEHRSDGPPTTGHSSVNGSRLLTADDLAARWQVPSSQVYRLTRDGRLPTVRLGRYYRYAPAAIEEFERAGGGSSG